MEPPGTQDAATIGTISHRAIQRAVSIWNIERPLADVDLLDLAARSAASVVPSQGTLRRAHLQRVAADTTNYLRWWLPPAGWTALKLAWTGPPVPDLAWATVEGVWYDELKTGRQGTRLPATRRQTEAQFAAGRARFGADFAGVRALSVQIPVGYQLGALSTDPTPISPRDPPLLLL